MKIVTFLALTLALSFSQEFDNNGLPMGFQAKANKLIKTPLNSSNSLRQVVTPKDESIEIDKVKSAIETMPAGKYLSVPLNNDLYLSLTKGTQGEAALRQVREWEQNGAPPQINYNGEIRYTLGSGTPLVIVKTSNLSDIKFQEGEEIIDILMGDSVRWEILHTTEGEGDRRTPHIVVKAKKPGITTSLIVSTNFRLYRIQLASSAIFDTPTVSFNFPERPDLLEKQAKEAMTAFNQQQFSREKEKLIKQYEEKLKNQDSRLLTLEEQIAVANASVQEDKKLERITNNKSITHNPAELDFNYVIKKSRFSKSPLWMPTQVYNDGTRTYIVIPEISRVTEIPILLMRYNGEDELVNYRVAGDRYIVDRIFEEASLLTGVGRNQKKVVIKYNGALRYGG